MTNLSTNLVVSARNYPDKTALRCGEDTLSFAEFDAAAARVATLLERAGIGPGDRVAVMLPNTAAFAIVFYGILRRGAIAVPMNPLLKAREIEYFLTNTAAAALFATPVFAEAARAAADAVAARLWLVDDDDLARLIADLPAQPVPVARAGGDTAVILHTSGTTGKPKGAELTHAGLAGNAEVTARTLIQIGPDDVVMGALPLFHVFGLTCGLNASVLGGRDADAGAAVRPAHRARGDRPRQGHRVRGRADHVCRDARCRRRNSTRRPRRACGCACPAARRCRWRCSPTSSRPSTR